MEIQTLENPIELGRVAAAKAAETIRAQLKQKGEANIILATGASQFETLNFLVDAEDLDWAKVRMFHLDEYIGMGCNHPASFRKYLRERFLNRIPGLLVYHFIHGDAPNPKAECEQLGRLIRNHRIDVALIGIGENGHLAFNDPPADFDTEEPFIVVELDEACRSQQLGEGWFASLEDVPTHAISMSIRQIMASRQLIVSVPDTRKAEAVKNAIKGEINPHNPAGMLQLHPDCHLFLDTHSASLL